MVFFRIAWIQVPVARAYRRPSVAAQKSAKDRIMNCERSIVPNGIREPSKPAVRELMIAGLYG
jgi:hypothetical protein